MNGGSTIKHKGAAVASTDGSDLSAKLLACSGTEARPEIDREPTSDADAWLGRPAGIWVVMGLVALILAAPLWVLADELRYSALSGDDFPFIADSLDWQATRLHLFEPHNAHIVPLFRLWTHGLVLLSGQLDAMPLVFRVGSYVGLIMTMLAVFLLVAKETRRTGVGLAAMAGLGISTVVEPAVSWYSAGQALWAGAAIILTIYLARNWSRNGGIWRLGLVVLGSLAAPAIWSGGLLAGPAAMAYAWGKNRLRQPVRLLVLAVVTLLCFLLVVGLTRQTVEDTGLIWEQRKELWPRPIQAVLHTTQAIAETLVLGNLGLDATTQPYQAVVLVSALIGLWAWSRGGFSRITPLEASGAVMAVGSYLLVYFFRGNLPFSSLRPLGWYHAIPQVGAVLFAAGWWDALRPTAPLGLTRRQVLGVLGFVGSICLLQSPRAERILLQYAPPLSPSEAKFFLIAELQRFRALYFREESLNRQIRALARLEKANPVAARLKLGPKTLRRIYGRVLMPGIPENQLASDIFSLLKLPPDDPALPVDVGRVRLALDDLFRAENEPRPPWLSPTEPWPRR